MCKSGIRSLEIKSITKKIKIMAKSSFNSDNKVTTKGTGAGNDKKSVAENSGNKSSGKSASSKP